MHFRPAIICLFILAACRPADTSLTVTTSAPMLTGEVTIHTPPEGALIYSEVVHISGTTAGLPGNQFELALTGPDTLTIATSTIRLLDESWQIELPLTYSGEPIEVTVTARPMDPALSVAYDLVTIVIAGLDYRPPGAFGAITFPREGSTTGGDQIPVAGTASGMVGNQLTLTLLAADGATLDSQTVNLANASLIDEMPWSAEVNTRGYLGEAILQISNQQIFDEINLTIETTAG